jgi:hypothetical protein
MRLSNAILEMKGPAAGISLFDLKLTNHTYKQFTREATNNIIRNFYGYELIDEPQNDFDMSDFSNLLDSLIFKNF